MDPAFSLAGASLSALLVYRQKAWGAFGFQILFINIPTYIKKVKLSSNLSKCVTAQDLGFSLQPLTSRCQWICEAELRLYFNVVKKENQQIPRRCCFPDIFYLSIFVLFSCFSMLQGHSAPPPTSLLDIQTARFGSLSPRRFRLFFHPLLILLAVQVLLRLLECFYILSVYHLYSFTGLRGSAGNGNISWWDIWHLKKEAL